MSTELPIIPPAGHDDPALSSTDVRVVLEHLVSGKPLDPVVLQRVRARAEQVSADIRRNRGLVDDDTFQSLLDDEA
jgi:hypothetical protein